MSMDMTVCGFDMNTFASVLNADNEVTVPVMLAHAMPGDLLEPRELTSQSHNHHSRRDVIVLHPFQTLNHLQAC